LQIRVNLPELLRKLIPQLALHLLGILCNRSIAILELTI
jgi:hypothetical protein